MLSPSLVPRNPLAFKARRGPSRRLHNNASMSAVQAVFDPHKTLGVSPGADEKEIKRAHRRLVLQHHPDLQQGKDGVEVKFLAIQEAYEILIGKRRGKEVDSTPAGWDFHDWYWKFSMNRRKSGAKSGAAAAGPPPPEATQHQWREQLSGLKAKAAAKAAASRGHSTGQTVTDPERPKNPTEAASSSVWRSTTKNARKTQSPGPGASNIAFSEATAQQRLHADSAPAPTMAAASVASPAAAAVDSQPQPSQPRIVPVTTMESTPPSHPTAQFSAAEDSSASHFIASTSVNVPNGAGASDQASLPTKAEESDSQQQQEHVAVGFKVLITKAVHAVHDLRHRHETTVHAHAQRIHSHIAVWSDKLTHRLRLHALQHLIAPEEELRYPSPLHWKNIRSSWEVESQGVPNDNELHALFEGAIHSMQGSMHTIGHDHSDSGSEFSDYSKSYNYSARDAHGRKFADREHVQTRLSTQLTGLKRRAALKREDED